MSGNGFHARYRTQLDLTDEAARSFVRGRRLRDVAMQVECGDHRCITGHGDYLSGSTMVVICQLVPPRSLKVGRLESKIAQDPDECLPYSSFTAVPPAATRARRAECSEAMMP